MHVHFVISRSITITVYLGHEDMNFLLCQTTTWNYSKRKKKKSERNAWQKKNLSSHTISWNNKKISMIEFKTMFLPIHMRAPWPQTRLERAFTSLSILFSLSQRSGLNALGSTKCLSSRYIPYRLHWTWVYNVYLSGLNAWFVQYFQRCSRAF